MPDFIETKLVELELPTSTPESPNKVLMDTGINGGIAEDMMVTKGQAISSSLASSIKRWDYPGEITPENVRRIHPKDFMFLAAKVTENLDLQISAQAVSTDEQKSSDTTSISAS